MRELPGSVLFACSHNAIRSPMAEVLLKYLHGRRIYVQSAGVRSGELDPFAVLVMDEMGIDLKYHRPRSFGELEDDYFDLVIRCHPRRSTGPSSSRAIARPSSSSGTCRTAGPPARASVCWTPIAMSVMS